MARLDYISYAIGGALIVVVGFALLIADSLKAPVLIYSAVVFVIALFGVTAFIFGYGLRPRKLRIPRSVPLSVPPSTPPPQAAELIADLKQVKGIGEKRAEKLKALGINTLADLSTASAKELAQKLKISPKITRQWVKESKQLLEK